MYCLFDSIATRYALGGPGSIPGGGEIFRAFPYRPWAPPSLWSKMYRVTLPGVKRPERGVD